MLVNENVIEQLCVDAGSTRTQKAKKYQIDIEISTNMSYYYTYRGYF